MCSNSAVLKFQSWFPAISCLWQGRKPRRREKPRLASHEGPHYSNIGLQYVTPIDFSKQEKKETTKPVFCFEKMCFHYKEIASHWQGFNPPALSASPLNGLFNCCFGFKSVLFGFWFIFVTTGRWLTASQHGSKHTNKYFPLIVGTASWCQRRNCCWKVGNPTQPCFPILCSAFLTCTQMSVLFNGACFQTNK